MKKAKSAGKKLRADSAEPPFQADPHESMARLTIDLNGGLHQRFKLACVIRRTTMVKEVTGFIEMRADIVPPGT